MHQREDGAGPAAHHPPHAAATVSGDDLGALVATLRADRRRLRHPGVDTPFVVAIVPAHDEAEHIGACVASLHRQSRPADLLVVVADNCTDDTAARAAQAGAIVVATVGNRDRKAGALNFALQRILGQLDADDGVLIMDADTELDDDFLAHAGERLWPAANDANDDRGAGDTPVGGVGGIFVGSRHLTDEDGRWSLVRQLQHNEYVRYARHLGRRRGRALVLTGTGSLFRAGALCEVALARRQGRLPDEGDTGSVYDTASLTEDNELTLSLKRLGYRTVSPRECTVYTALMPCIGTLVDQRRRWQRGALENLGSHGLRRTTAPYLLRQVGTYLGVLFLPLYLMTLGTSLVRWGGVDWLHPLWITVAVAYLVEQAWSVRRGGLRSVGTSLAVIPELWHTVLLNGVYAVSLLGLLAGTGERWGRGADERSAEQLASNRAPPVSGAPRRPVTNDARPNPLDELSGTHDARQWWRLLLVPTTVLLASGLVIGLPLLALSAAWTAIALFVLAGFALTLVRLIPLPMA